MTLSVSTLRPGLLVSLRTSITGNVMYQTKIVEAEHYTEDGMLRSRKETERTIRDPEEHEAVKRARGYAVSLIRRVCAASDFGLLCAEDRQSELDEAVAKALEIVRASNETSKQTRLSFNVLTGRIVPDDEQAVRSINAEIKGLLETMQNGLVAFDVEAIRDAANKARGLSQMLNPEASDRIQTAITIARTSANKIARAGQDAARTIDEDAIRRIAAQRTAFLDLDDPSDIATPTILGRVVDFQDGDFDLILDEDTRTPAEKAWATRRSKQDAAKAIEALLEEGIETALTNTAGEGPVIEIDEYVQ